MEIKAKFRCIAVVDRQYGKEPELSTRQVEFNAVCGTSAENASFAKATPYGTLTLQIDRDTAAYNAFEPGKEYYLTIAEAL
jgi:hypothetical protein